MTGCFIREGNDRLFYQGGNDNRLFYQGGDQQAVLAGRGTTAGCFIREGNDNRLF